MKLNHIEVEQTRHSNQHKLRNIHLLFQTTSSLTSIVSSSSEHEKEKKQREVCNLFKQKNDRIYELKIDQNRYLQIEACAQKRLLHNIKL